MVQLVANLLKSGTLEASDECENIVVKVCVFIHFERRLQQRSVFFRHSEYGSDIVAER